MHPYHYRGILPHRHQNCLRQTRNLHHRRPFQHHSHRSHLAGCQFLRVSYLIFELMGTSSSWAV